MIRLFALAAFACATILSACTHPTYFRHPLSPAGEAGHDERLVGTWISRNGDGGIYYLKIEPSKSEGEAGLLAISATMMFIDADGERQVGVGRFNRVAYASVVDGEIYYNIRSADPGSAFVILSDSGSRTPDPDYTEWFNTPGHVAREYWIAKPEFTDDGRLWLGFIAAGQWDRSELVGAGLAQHLMVHGQGASVWQEDCGEYCSYARADLRPETLAEIIRTYPREAVFNLLAGPFARVDAALPEYDYALR